jgi:uncharacterized Zn finger protein
MSNNANQVGIIVNTALLRQIIDANPEVKLQLEGLASEKIAEEIFRKVRGMNLEDIQRRVDTETNVAFNRAMSNFNDRYKFPPEAAREIGRIAKELVERHITTTAADLAIQVDKILQVRTELAVKDVVARASAEIRQLARQEFLSVLREVKGAVV